MKRIYIALISLILSLPAFADVAVNATGKQMPYSVWMTRSEMKRNPKSYLLDFSKKPKWSYVMGIELEPMLNTFEKYGGDDIRAYCQEYIDTMIMSGGSIRGYKMEDYNLDNVRTGKFVTAMYRRNPSGAMRNAITTLLKQLADQPRTNEGVYWHKAIYAWQVWLDGIFMGLPVRVANAAEFYPPEEARKIYDDAVDQLKRTYARTYDAKTGLNRHAWDETRLMFWADPDTGLSSHCWGRAQGWYTMALVEILDALPEDYNRRGEVEELLEKSLAGIMRWQDPESGVWFQVMDSPGREGNYLEASASAMFVYAMLRAANRGYVGKEYIEHGKKAYQAILDNFIRHNDDGTISLTNCCAVAGLGPGTSEPVRKAAPKVTESNTRRDGSFSYYLSEPVRDNDAKGVGPFIWASLEMENLMNRADIVVAQDGSGDFTSIQDAINACPDFRKDTTTVLIREGIYRERVNISPSKTKLKLVGEGNVVISCDSVAKSRNITGDEMGTYGCATCFIFPNDFTAENITFSNRAGVAAGQAVAALTGGDRMFFKNCRFLGFQDTLFAWGLGRQYYEDCYVEGSVDFIFGPATAVFKDCEIRLNRDKGYITAPSTPKESRYGFVFLNCDLTANEGVKDCWLSRPWRDYGKTAFIGCNIGGHIRPDGYHNWRKPEREKTSYYAEYGNKGAGADTSKRAFGYVLDSPDGYTPAEILAGWHPAGATF